MSALTFLSASVILFGGALCFSLMFYLSRWFMRKKYDESILTERKVASICMRCVSAVQGVICCVCGLIIISNCEDLVHQTHWLTNIYVLIGTGYLVYDTWATYSCFLLDNPSAQSCSLAQGLARFVHKDPAMMFHHVCLPIVYLPVVMYLRHGVGDGLIGCFMMIEATVPFISFREILVLLDQTKTWLYFFNGVLTLVVYTSSRILIFPWMLWLYGQQINRTWYHVPFLLPNICLAGTAIFLTLYTYWWFVILGIARKEFVSWFKPLPSAKAENNLKNNSHNDQSHVSVSNEKKII